MPSVEASCAIGFIFIGEYVPVERFMRRMLKLYLVESFMIAHETVTDELDLGDSRYPPNVGVYDGLLIHLTVSVTVVIGDRVKGPGQSILLFRRKIDIAEE